MKDLLEKYPILPAPMEGVMRPAVINACNLLELTPVWITPFFRVTEHIPKARELTKFMAPFMAGKVPVIVQLMGTRADNLAGTAKLALELGASGIDLNCGCPSGQVVAHGAGAGALREVEKTARIIEAIRQSIGNGFFSVKTRLGFDNVEEAARFLPLWENAGAVDLFTLHYRTAREGYRTVAGRTERLQTARNYVKNAMVFGNGDLQTVDEAKLMMQECNMQGALIGRAFWRDPAILRNYYCPEKSLDPIEAPHQLWQILSEQPYGSDGWTLGSAIEMASLILGPLSPEASALKKSHSTKKAAAKH